MGPRLREKEEEEGWEEGKAGEAAEEEGGVPMSTLSLGLATKEKADLKADFEEKHQRWKAVSCCGCSCGSLLLGASGSALREGGVAGGSERRGRRSEEAGGGIGKAV